MNPTLLEIKKLTVEFRKKEGAQTRSFAAVSDLTLSVAAGSFTSIVGESGSGKSVTALSITRLNKPFRRTGSIEWRGIGGSKELLSLSDTELLKVRGNQIAYIFQDPGSFLNPVLKVGEQIGEAYQAHVASDKTRAGEKTRELLSSLKIKDPERVYHAYPHELSGGMKQRALIAMALIAGPKLLIADEPTTALDADTESQIMDLLAGLQKQKGLTVLFITHNIALAARYSDAITVMEKGKAVERLEHQASGFVPSTDYARRLFAAGLMELPPKHLIGV